MNNFNDIRRIMALDVGKKRIGAALSDELQLTCSPFKNFQITGSLDQVINEILKDCDLNKVGTIVLGMPLELDGGMGEQAIYTKKFATRMIKRLLTSNSEEIIENLELNTFIPCGKFSLFLIDERFTSVQAESYIKSPKLKNSSRREVKDNITACILIETYLQMSSLSKR